MATRQWSLFLILTAISIIAGCGGGTTAHVQNPPAPAAPQVSIAFQPTPPSSLVFGGTAPVTAVVSNDPSDSGVDWNIPCQNPGSCGSLTLQHTASGQATIYTPPPSLSSNAQGVSIFAFATADHTKNVTASLTITAFSSFLKAGTYIVETTGISPTGSYQRAAAIMLDGNGNVQGGEETVNSVNQTTSLFSSVAATVTGGSYFIGPDGRGTLTINTPAGLNLGQQVGQQDVETFNLVALSSSQALLTASGINNPNLPLSNESSIGTMDLQTPGAQAITGGYALVVRGYNANGSPVAYGGVLNIIGSQSIPGTGSKFDEVIDGSTTVTPSALVSGSVSAPDSFGTIQISLTTDFGNQVFTGYVIDASHLKLIETDDTIGLTAGVAIGQGPLTGTYSSFSGTYTLGIFGSDLNQQVATLAAAASFQVSAGSLTNGSIDELQSGLSVQITDGFSATYTVDLSGRVDTGSSFTFTKHGPGPELIFYLTGNGNPVLVLDADTEPSLSGGSVGGGVGTGLAYPSTAGATFSGDYGLSFTQNFTGTEGDATGQICVNGSSVTCPLPTGTVGAPDTLFGTIDETLSFSPQGPTSLTDGFQASATSGRLTGTMSAGSDFNNSTLTMAFYLIDSSHGFFIETDGGSGETNQGGLTFGYFAGRTPVCQGCP